MDQANGEAGAVSVLLRAWVRGDLQAREDLASVVHGELGRRAGAHFFAIASQMMRRILVDHRPVPPRATVRVMPTLNSCGTRKRITRIQAT